MQIEIKIDDSCKEPKIIEQTDIIHIYAADGKVLASTNDGEYTLRLRLYELEERLDANHFVRISNSEIINLKKVKGFDLSFVGTICVSLSDGTVTHLIVCSLATLPVAYFMHWMEHSLWGIIGYFAIFFVIYLIIWLFQYSSMKKRVQQLNAKIQENNTENSI